MERDISSGFLGEVAGLGVDFVTLCMYRHAFAACNNRVQIENATVTRREQATVEIIPLHPASIIQTLDTVPRGPEPSRGSILNPTLNFNMLQQL